MSQSLIRWQEAACVFIVMLLQGPTGVMADRIGRKTTMIIGNIFLVAELVLFATATGPKVAFLANLSWAIGFSLISGADTSFLFDTLKALGNGHEYRERDGVSRSRFLVLSACCCLISGYLAKNFSIRLPIAIDALFAAAALGIICCFTEPPRRPHTDHWWATLCSGFKTAYHTPRVWWVIIFSATIAAASKFWFFTYNPYFALNGLEYSTFGWIFFAINLSSAISSYYANELSNKLGERGSALLSFLVIALPMVLMGLWVAPLACWLIVVQSIVRGQLPPFTSAIINHEIADSGIRATVHSAKSTFGSLIDFSIMVSSGFLVGLISLPNALVIGGLVVATTGVVVLIKQRRLPTS